MYMIMLDNKFCKFSSGGYCRLADAAIDATRFLTERQAVAKRKYAQKNGVRGIIPRNYHPVGYNGYGLIPNIPFEVCEVEIIVNIVQVL